MSHLFILIHIPGLIFVTVCSVYVDKYIKLNITFNHSILSLSNEHLNWRPAVELTKRNFTVLYEYLKNPYASQREVAERTGLSLGSVNAANKELTNEGLLESDSLTDSGYEALHPL